MRVLYIGHYKEFGGWSQAATDQILALDAVGVDVVCRNVTLTSDKTNVHPRKKTHQIATFAYSISCRTIS